MAPSQRVDWTAAVQVSEGDRLHSQLPVAGLQRSPAVVQTTSSQLPMQWRVSASHLLPGGQVLGARPQAQVPVAGTQASP